jgi:hypothetical protein
MGNGGKDVAAVVIGFNAIKGPPLWNAPVPPSCKVYRMPEHIKEFADCVAYATSLGGVYAFGWLVDGPIDRTEK